MHRLIWKKITKKKKKKLLENCNLMSYHLPAQDGIAFSPWRVVIHPSIHSYVLLISLTIIFLLIFPSTHLSIPLMFPSLFRLPICPPSIFIVFFFFPSPILLSIYYLYTPLHRSSSHTMVRDSSFLPFIHSPSCPYMNPFTHSPFFQPSFLPSFIILSIFLSIHSSIYSSIPPLSFIFPVSLISIDYFISLSFYFLSIYSSIHYVPFFPFSFHHILFTVPYIYLFTGLSISPLILPHVFPLIYTFVLCSIHQCSPLSFPVHIPTKCQ